MWKLKEFNGGWLTVFEGVELSTHDVLPWVKLSYIIFWGRKLCYTLILDLKILVQIFFHPWYMSIILETFANWLLFTLTFYSALSLNLALQIFSTVYMSMFSCIPSHPKIFSLHFKSFEFVSEQLHLSLHFISMLFAKFMKRGILVISYVKTLFNF
jgi:hypothetical protein